jgi:arginine/lysine/ornithine decarboxylase
VSDEQRETPYLDALIRYRDAGFTVFHTPGHKCGRGAPAKIREAFGMTLLQADLPMAGGIEDTRESTGLVRAAEDLAAEAWGADRAFFLINGSTSGMHALMITLAGPGDHVIVPRNSHKSLLAALVFSGAMPLYMEPLTDPEWGIALTVTARHVQRALAERPDATALFVTSPTYNGLCADLPTLALLTHGAGVPFAVDQAWGPHLRFCSRLPVDALTAGADAAIVSVHKLISAITQSSVLLARGERLNLPRLESIVKMTQSTSPQTIMLASTDGARQQMATEGEALWARAVDLAERARAEIGKIDGLRCLGHEFITANDVAAFDPTRLTITAQSFGHTGYQLETILRDEYRIAVEAADSTSVILNVTHGDRREDLERLVAALRDYAARYAAELGAKRPRVALLRAPSCTRQILSPREAFFAPSVALPIDDCVGAVSAEIVTPYPPGIPVLGPGELIGDETVAYLREAAARGLHIHGPEDPTLATLRVIA